MRAPAQVVPGMRQPDTVPTSVQFPATERQPTALLDTKIAEGERVYHTAHAGLIVQITSPADRFDPATGSVHRARPAKAIFKPIGEGTLGEYRTKDPTEWAELEGNVRFGLGRSYWRADEFAAKARETMKESVKAQLRNDPDLVTEVLQEMTANEFELPTAK